MAKPSHTTMQPPGLVRRFLTSIWLKMLVFGVAFVLLSTLIASGAHQRIAQDQSEHLERAVRRAAVQCYALEGRYPSNLAYLEEHYSLIIDKSRFAVYYEPKGENLTPSIIVVTF